MKTYKCAACGKKIEPIGDDLVCVTSNADGESNVMCSQECVMDYFDINFVPACDLPEILDDESEMD